MKIKGKDYSEETIQNALEAYIKAEIAEAERSRYYIFPGLDIFADLKQYAEDCEETDVMGIPIEIDEDVIRVGKFVIEPKEAIAFANLIKQVAYTQLRKEGK